jgi:hypothetical protein
MGAHDIELPGERPGLLDGEANRLGGRGAGEEARGNRQTQT